MPAHLTTSLLRLRRVLLRVLQLPLFLVNSWWISYLFVSSLRHFGHTNSLTPVEVKYVPDWFPGARFKKLAKHARNLLPPFVDEPFNTVKRDSVSSHNLNLVKVASLIILGAFRNSETMSRFECAGVTGRGGYRSGVRNRREGRRCNSLRG